VDRHPGEFRRHRDDDHRRARLGPGDPDDETRRRRPRGGDGRLRRRADRRTGGRAGPEIGEEDVADVPGASDLFKPSTTARVVVMQNVVPIVSTVGAYLTFRFLPVFGF